MLTKEQCSARHRACVANAERATAEIAQIWRQIADSYLYLAEHEIEHAKAKS